MNMELLKRKICEEGAVIPPDIVKVDSFLNHQIDVDLLDEIGQEFYRRFRGKEITKILTIEASGIAVACFAAKYFHVPVVFAKKHENRNMDEQVYEVKIHSFTKNKDYIARVAKQYLSSEDKILIVDDFLANGEAANGLVRLVEQAGAKLAGVGIVIEKDFQNGGKSLRSRNILVESLAVIENITEEEIIFK